LADSGALAADRPGGTAPGQYGGVAGHRASASRCWPMPAAARMA